MKQLIFVAIKWSLIAAAMIIMVVYDHPKPVLVFTVGYMCIQMMKDELERMNKELEKKIKELAKKKLTD